MALPNFRYLSEEEFSSLRKILKKNSEIPYIKGDEWKGTDLLHHEIRLSTDKPVNVKKHKIPYKLIDTVNKQIEEWLEM